MTNEKSFRNPTPEEVEILRNTTDENVTPLSKAKAKTNNDPGLLKPKSSPFEPDPVPFKLPSLNFNNIDPKKLTADYEIYVRRITTLEESKFLEIANDTENFMKGINLILSSCIKSNIDVNDLSLIDKIAVFIFIISISYGSEYEIELACDLCDESVERKIDLINDLETKYIPKKTKYPIQVELTSFNNVTIQLRYPTIGDEDGFLGLKKGINMTKQIMSITSDIIGNMPGSSQEITDSDWKEVINNLNSEDRKTIRGIIGEFGNYGKSVSVDHICKNKSCEKFNEKQKIAVPLDVIFIKALSNDK